MPIFNDIAALIGGFIDKHIVHIPDSAKEEFKADAAALAAKLLEAGAKGATEGLAGKAESSGQF